MIQTKPCFVALYDIRPVNGAGLFLQPRSPHGANMTTLYTCDVHLCVFPSWQTVWPSGRCQRTAVHSYCWTCAELNSCSSCSSSWTPCSSDLSSCHQQPSVTSHLHFFPPQSASIHLECLLGLYWTRLTLLNGFSFLV